MRLDYVAASPAGMRALAGVYGHVANSGLAETLVALVYLRVSQINGCAYCIDMHSRDLIDRGVAVGKLVLVPAWREAGSLFDDKERAALAWAESLTRIETTGVPDEAYAAASAEFEARDLTDLTIAVGLMNAYNRLAVGFRRPPGSALADSPQAGSSERSE